MEMEDRIVYTDWNQ